MAYLLSSSCCHSPAPLSPLHLLFISSVSPIILSSIISGKIPNTLEEYVECRFFLKFFNEQSDIAGAIERYHLFSSYLPLFSSSSLLFHMSCFLSYRLGEDRFVFLLRDLAQAVTRVSEEERRTQLVNIYQLALQQWLESPLPSE